MNPKAKFTMISDCCHSGGMLDHKEVVIDGDKKDDNSERDIDWEADEPRCVGCPFFLATSDQRLARDSDFASLRSGFG